MKFIHISDVHLGHRPDPGYPWSESREEELWKTFSSILEVCKKRSVDLLLISGDLFDGQPSLSQLRRVNDLFAQIPETKIMLIAGACDHFQGDTGMKAFDWERNVHLFGSEELSSVVLPELSVTVQGVSCMAETCSEPLLDELQAESGDIRILLAYAGKEGQIPADPQKLAQAGFDYIALGSSHSSRKIASAHMVYAGSPEPLCMEDTGKHGYFFGEITDTVNTVTFVPCACREYISLKAKITSDIQAVSLLARLKEIIEEQGTNNIYRIILTGKYRPGHPFERSALQKLGNIIEVDDRTIPDYDLPRLLEEHRDDVVGMYIEELLGKPADRTLQKALYCGLDALLFQEDDH